MAAVISNLPISESTEPTKITVGQRIVQVLAPDMGHIGRVVIRDLADLDETSRGEGGFGSTGK